MLFSKSFTFAATAIAVLLAPIADADITVIGKYSCDNSDQIFEVSSCGCHKLNDSVADLDIRGITGIKFVATYSESDCNGSLLFVRNDVCIPISDDTQSFYIDC